jgi:hypothetical protein
MTPDEFRKEYVESSVELWRVNNTVTHLAANAIAQLDALADVVWVAQGRPGRISDFREDLGRREPAIAVVRDACDSHKHGELGRPTAVHISGERPAVVARAGFFAGRSRAGGPPIRYQALVIRKRDGTEQDVSKILFEAMQAWRREFERSGYGADWLVLGRQH